MKFIPKYIFFKVSLPKTYDWTWTKAINLLLLTEKNIFCLFLAYLWYWGEKVSGCKYLLFYLNNKHPFPAITCRKLFFKSYVIWQYHFLTTGLQYVLISCSWHQTTEQNFLFSPIFFANFSQFDQMKKKTNFLLAKN